MFKRLMIGGFLVLTVVVGLGGAVASVYAWSMALKKAATPQPSLVDVMEKVEKAQKDSLENSVPLETEIGRLKAEVKGLEHDEHAYYDQVAKQSVEMDKLRKDVEDTMARMDKHQSDIAAMRKDLGSAEKTSFKYGSRNYTRDEMTQQLARDLKAFEGVEMELQAKKKNLSAAEKLLAASEDQLGSLKAMCDELTEELVKVEAASKLVSMRASGSGAQEDDGELAARADIAKMRERINNRQKQLELQSQFNKAP